MAAAVPVSSQHTARAQQTQPVAQRQPWNHRTVCSQITDLVQSVAFSVTAVALSAIIATASIFLTIVLGEIVPLTLFATIPMTFGIMSHTITEVTKPILCRSEAAWNRAVGTSNS